MASTSGSTLTAVDDDSVENEDLFVDNPWADEEEIIAADAIENINAALHDLAMDQNTEGPDLDDWVDVDFDFVTVSLGQATHDIWEQAKNEIDCSRKSFEKFFATQTPSFQQLAGFFFGPESELFRVIKDEITWTFEEWACLLKTFWVQCAYKVSATNLYSSSGYIKEDGLMPQEEYIAKWRQLGTTSLPNDERAAPAALETLWMKVETAINSMLRRFVVEPWLDADDTKRLEAVGIVFDDNKMWFDARVAAAFLQIVQHVRDNRRGPVHHDAVASATGQLAGIHFERKKDTSVSSMKAITKNQFVPAQGGTELQHLNWLQGRGDRAYTTKEGLYGFFLPSGARVRGTKKRSKDWPLSYGVDLKDGDKRTDIPTSGAKSMFMKSAMVGDRTVYAAAYRNGNGGVTLGVTTESDNVYHWDVTLKNPADRQWFFRLSEGKILQLESFRRAFRPLTASRATDVISEELVALLLKHPVKPLTMGQSHDHAWWICRMFAFGSTGSERAFLIYDGTETELDHKPSWAVAKSFLRKSGERSWNQVLKKEEPSDPEEVTTESNRADEAAEDGAAEDGVVYINVINLERLFTDDDYATMIANALDPQEEEEEVEVYVDAMAIQNALRAGGATLSKAADENQRLKNDTKKLLDWCRQHRLLRPLFAKKTAATLKRLASKLSPPCLIPDDVTAANRIFDTIKVFLEQNPDAEIVGGGAEAERSAADLPQRERLLYAVLQAAFLKKQKGNDREDTRRGLDLEKPLARKLVVDSTNGLTAGFRVHEVASVPVVERTGIDNQSAIGSTDFIATVVTPESDGSLELVAIEVKARVKEGTAAKERSLQGIARLRMQSRNGLADRNQKYFAITADDPSFAYFINKRREALQILHHAYVYDVKWVLLLIGDAYDRIIAGVWINFDSILKASWGNVLHDMHRLSVQFLYDNPCEPFVLSEEVEAMLEPILSLITVASGKLDLHSFRQQVMIWRVVRLVWPKPLPMISKLLPYIFSSWNAAKGGSDTISKMLWSAKYDPPNKLPQAHAIGRMLLLLGIQVHRANQIATSKPSLPYRSLLHFRNAANKRFSLHGTILQLSHAFDPVLSVDTDAAPTTSPVRISLSPRAAEASVELVGRTLRGSKPTLRVTAPGLPITGSTPQRQVKAKLDKLLDGTVPPARNQQLVIDRFKECTGILAYGLRGSCCICGSRTLWFCLGCHTNVCMNDAAKANDSSCFDCDEIEIMIPPLPGSGASAKEFVITNKCFLHLHRAAIFRKLGIDESS